MNTIVNLMHEFGMLAKTPRSGFAFLGSGQQSVAEHSHRMTLIAFILAEMSKDPLDKHKLMMMCLFHDLPETRTGDLNYVNKKYVHVDNEKVLSDLSSSSSLGPMIVNYIREYEEGKTPEAKIAKDADQLELLLVLKQEWEKGNNHAVEWFDIAIKRLNTKDAQCIADEIRKRPSTDWWVGNKADPHWIKAAKEKTHQ